MGIVLKPREFQRITLIQLGRKPLADELDEKNIVFSKSDKEEPMEMGKDFFLPALAKLLIPLLLARSAFGPIVEERVLVAPKGAKEKVASATSHSSDLLAKIGSGYNGYRYGIMDLVAHAQDIAEESGVGELTKLGSASVGEVFTPLSVAYLKDAFMDEFGVTASGVVKLSSGIGQRGEGFPLEEHVANQR
jgi:hypothetical protein